MSCETSQFPPWDDGGETKRFPLGAAMMILEVDP